MKNYIYLMTLAALLCMTVLIGLAESKPQITFSTDWYGGKRDLLSAAAQTALADSKLDAAAMLPSKRQPGWGKRSSGWGKRANHLNDEQENKIENYELMMKKIESLRQIEAHYITIASEVKNLIDMLEANVEAKLIGQA